MMNCDACGKTFTGIVCYQQHLESEKHKKKMRLLSSEKSPICNSVSETERCADNSNESLFCIKRNTKSNAQDYDNKLFTLLKCEICAKQFSGPVPYDQHLNSEAHKKRVQSKSSYPQLIYHESNLNCNVSSTTDSVLQNTMQSPISVNTSWYCNLCNVQCNGCVTYNSHVSGTCHKKKRKRAELEELHQSISENRNKQLSDMLLTSQQQLSSTKKTNLAIQHVSNVGSNCSKANETNQMLCSCKVESGIILPNALESFEPLSLETLDLKFFWPQTKLNFDVKKIKLSNEETKIKTNDIITRSSNYGNEQEVNIL